ncbi:MAG: TonB-dependent receptor plug domain-containing protein, partial [Acidobacteria bacterium]|nr:TonB-dependent receptor plug domain-containing protein [Acidobacteriota bacterium]
LCCALITLTTTFAQTVSGTITGTVLDASGSSIAGAKVTLVNERNSDERTGTSNSNGYFQFVAVPPGLYTIKIEAQGFRTLERRNNTLTASEQLSVGNLALTVGQVTESVTTVAEGAVVETESAANSALITANQIEQISTKGRDVVDLLRLVPGVAYGDDIDGLGTGGTGFGTVTPNVGGTRNTFNTFAVDGVPGNDLGSPNINSGTVNLDAIGEVKVELNNYRAESGRNAGAIVKVITKSGTNQYHGSGYWYKRHEGWNAQNFFNNLNKLRKPNYRFLTLGATIGGPVVIPKLYNPSQKKLFFFYSFEGAQTQTPQAIRTVTVPTALERAGDFSQSYNTNSAATNATNKLWIRDPLLSGTCNQTYTAAAPATAENTVACFPNFRIPANRISAATQGLFSVFPLPNALDRVITLGNYNYNFQESVKVPKTNHLVRVDYKLSDKDSFYVKGSKWYADNNGFAVGAGGANWGLVRSHYTFRDDALTANWVRLFSPRLVNEAQVGLRHSTEIGRADTQADLDRITKVKTGFNIPQLFPQFNPLGLLPQTNFGIANNANITYDGRYPSRGADTFITFDNNTTYTLASHTIKAGVYVERLRNYEGAQGTFSGNFNFSRDVNNPLDTNWAYANALLGNFTSYVESTTRPSTEGRATTVEMYGQDVWKASRRLTVEIGMRVARYTNWIQAHEQASAFALERYDRSKAPRLYEPTLVNGARRARDPISGQILPVTFIGLIVPNSGNLTNGMVTQADPNFPDSFVNQPGPRFEPRIGFGYNLLGNGKTALRGGFGVFHNTRPGGGIWRNLTLNPPTQFNPTFFYGNYDTLRAQSGTANFSPSNVVGFQRDGKTPVIYNWTLGIQQDLGFKTLLSVSYNGSRSNFLLQSRNLNLVPYGAQFLPANIDPTITGNRPLPDNFFRPYPGYGNITYNEYASSSNYHALQVQANRRFSKGLQYGLAYTWSKTMDLTDTDGGGVAVYAPTRIWNYGKAGFDQKHNFVFNYTWDVPKVGRRIAKDNKLVKGVFDGWQLSGTTALVSGRPAGITFSTTDGQNITGGGDGARVVILKPAVLDEKKEGTNSNGTLGTVQWLDKSAFGRPALGDRGNAPKDVFRLPGVHNWDMSLFKNFPFFSEKTKLQFRWEIYNLFNHTQFNAVNTAAQFDAAGAQISEGFGRVTSARNPRVMQGSLRLTF